MDFNTILIFSIVLTVVLFSSGIAIISSAHLEFFKTLGKRSGRSGLIANQVLSVIAMMGKMRRTWIRWITPGIDRGC